MEAWNRTRRMGVWTPPPGFSDFNGRALTVPVFHADDPRPAGSRRKATGNGGMEMRCTRRASPSAPAAESAVREAAWFASRPETASGRPCHRQAELVRRLLEADGDHRLAGRHRERANDRRGDHVRRTEESVPLAVGDRDEDACAGLELQLTVEPDQQPGR